MERKKIRLNKFIAQAGLCSRRDADELISAGKVKVNGEKITELGYCVSESDKVTVNNKSISAKKFDYVLFNKPAGYITTCDDENSRKTIYEFFPEHLKHLKAVGRLDKDSSGLLIMTNDGELINKLTHPSVKVPKTYRVVVKGKMKESHLQEMANGIEIEPKKIAYADVCILEYDSDKNTILEIILHQGLNRQIRKMTDYLGFPVISLKRVSHGPLSLMGLKKGQYKFLRPKQIKDLYNYIRKIEK